MSVTTAARISPLVPGLDEAHQRITPVLRPSLYSRERGKWDVELTITRTKHMRHRPGSYELRFGVGYIDERGLARREHGGARVPGPYAYAYGLGTVIAADPRMSTGYESRNQRAAGLEVHVEEGDVLRLGWDLFRVRYDRDEWIDLDHVGSVL